MGSRTGLDDVEGRKILPLPGLELQIVGHPARRADCSPTYYVRTGVRCGWIGNRRKKLYRRATEMEQMMTCVLAENRVRGDFQTSVGRRPVVCRSNGGTGRELTENIDETQVDLQDI
jgi:hypothetical protein